MSRAITLNEVSALRRRIEALEASNDRLQLRCEAADDAREQTAKENARLCAGLEDIAEGYNLGNDRDFARRILNGGTE